MAGPWRISDLVREREPSAAVVAGVEEGRVRWFVYVIDFRVEEYTRDHD
jgi:hypothetical protein